MSKGISGDSLGRLGHDGMNGADKPRDLGKYRPHLGVCPAALRREGWKRYSVVDKIEKPDPQNQQQAHRQTKAMKATRDFSITIYDSMDLEY